LLLLLLFAEEFIGARNVDHFFLSVDWSGGWLQLLNTAELAAVETHSSCHALNVTPEVKTVGTTTTASTSTSTNPSPPPAGMHSPASTPDRRKQLSQSGVMTLEKCLQEHTKEETLDEANAWYCSKCQKHQCAKKISTFWAPSLPKVLIVVLKRFEFRDFSAMTGRNVAHREKIETFVDFPINGLDLANFCGNSLSEETKSQYDLFAVCNHYGRMGFGHYTAFARDWKAETLSDSWSSFDDGDVEPCHDDQQVVSKAAYMLFYRRRP
jgi:uncharacterized UBP type Zn finger protein